MQQSFFKEMAMIGPGFQLTMTVKEKNGKLTISVMPDGIENVKPLLITGTPDELEEGFWNAVRKPLQDARGVIVHNEEYEKSLSAAKKVEKPAASKQGPDKGKDKPAAKPPAKKELEKGPQAVNLFEEEDNEGE